MERITENIPLESSIGVCVRNHSQEVLFQNELCSKICGKREGRCVDGCQELCSQGNEGMQFFPKKTLGNCLSDIVIIDTGEQAISLFLPLERQFQREMDYIKEKNLSKRELQVASLAARGLSNREIVKELCISRATLKTHLNVIYKKIPDLKASGFRRSVYQSPLN